jgi:hypothetical protein
MNEMWSNKYFSLHVKYPLFFSDINETWIFSTDFRKNLQISNLIKIHPVGAELFHADGRTDKLTYMTNIIGAFRSFAEATINECTLLYSIYNNTITKATNSYMFQEFLAPFRKYNICIKWLLDVLHSLMMVAYVLLS